MCVHVHMCDCIAMYVNFIINVRKHKKLQNALLIITINTLIVLVSTTEQFCILLVRDVASFIK